MTKHSDAMRQLRETVAWCTWRSAFGQPCDSLRFTWLRPPCLSQIRSDSERTQVVQRLANQRHELLQTYPGSPRTLPRISGSMTSLGRLLLYFPDETLFDGAAEVASHGLFDTDNEPPWDTWVLYREADTKPFGWSRFLLAWIPQRYAELADIGVRANPEACIRWISGSDLSFVRSLSSD